MIIYLSVKNYSGAEVIIVDIFFCFSDGQICLTKWKTHVSRDNRNTFENKRNNFHLFCLKYKKETTLLMEIPQI